MARKVEIPKTNNDISNSLKQIANCLGALVITSLSKQEKSGSDQEKPDQVAVLFHLGFNRTQIAAILQTSVNAVNLQISRQGLSKKREAKAVEEN